MVSILLRLTGKGVVALPVHDSIIVRGDRASIAREVMEECFRGIAGVPAGVRVKVG